MPENLGTTNQFYLDPEDVKRFIQSAILAEKIGLDTQKIYAPKRPEDPVAGPLSRNLQGITPGTQLGQAGIDLYNTLGWVKEKLDSGKLTSNDVPMLLGTVPFLKKRMRRAQIEKAIDAKEIFNQSWRQHPENIPVPGITDKVIEKRAKIFKNFPAKVQEKNTPLISSGPFTPISFMPTETTPYVDTPLFNMKVFNKNPSALKEDLKYEGVPAVTQMILDDLKKIQPAGKYIGNKTTTTQSKIPEIDLKRYQRENIPYPISHPSRGSVFTAPSNEGDMYKGGSGSEGGNVGIELKNIGIRNPLIIRREDTGYIGDTGLNRLFGGGKITKEISDPLGASGPYSPIAYDYFGKKFESPVKSELINAKYNLADGSINWATQDFLNAISHIQDAKKRYTSERTGTPAANDVTKKGHKSSKFYRQYPSLAKRVIYPYDEEVSLPNKFSNPLTYQRQERMLANAARQAGYDSIVSVTPTGRTTQVVLLDTDNEAKWRELQKFQKFSTQPQVLHKMFKTAYTENKRKYNPLQNKPGDIKK